MISTSTLSKNHKIADKNIEQKRLIEREFLGKVSCEEVVGKIITVQLQEKRNN